MTPTIWHPNPPAPGRETHQRRGRAWPWRGCQHSEGGSGPTAAPGTIASAYTFTVPCLRSGWDRLAPHATRQARLSDSKALQRARDYPWQACYHRDASESWFLILPGESRVKRRLTAMWDGNPALAGGETGFSEPDYGSVMSLKITKQVPQPLVPEVQSPSNLNALAMSKQISDAEVSRLLSSSNVNAPMAKRISDAVVSGVQSSSNLNALKMPKPESEPLPARVKSSFKQLAEATAALNTASDKLSKQVGQVEALMKPLNIGIECWVKMGQGWSSAESRGHWEVGYVKVAGKWSIGIRAVDDSEPEYPDPWAFGDAPRRLRLKAVDYIPALLDELAKKAVEATSDIDKKMEDVSELVAALKESASQ